MDNISLEEETSTKNEAPTVEQLIFSTGEGNPGALRVILDSILVADKIDPDNAFGRFGFLANLQSLGLKGPLIWCLFKDVCGESLPKAIAMVRAAQLGIISQEELHDKINSGSRCDDHQIFDELLERLPKFNLEYTHEKEEN